MSRRLHSAQGGCCPCTPVRKLAQANGKTQDLDVGLVNQKYIRVLDKFTHICEELVQAEGVGLGGVPLELHRLPVRRRLRSRAVVHPLEALVGPEAPRVLAVAPCRHEAGTWVLLGWGLVAQGMSTQLVDFTHSPERSLSAR